MSEWQPIETAPKDGSEIIFYFEGLTYVGKYYRTFFDIDNYWIGFHPNGKNVIEPTHWMPLPEPPKDSPNAE